MTEVARADGARTSDAERRAAQTRRILLAAAREVFTERGFAEASVVEVVRQARSSIASVYHHFGGKAELFVALWEEHQRAQEARAANAVAEARRRGERDPMSLFVAGARAFLEGSWLERDLVRLFYDGDGPPGFEPQRRQRGREWVRQNAVLLGAEDKPVDRVKMTIFTSVIGEAGREVSSCENLDEAHRLIEAIIGFVRQLRPGYA